MDGREGKRLRVGRYYLTTVCVCVCVGVSMGVCVGCVCTYMGVHDVDTFKNTIIATTTGRYNKL